MISLAAAALLAVAPVVASVTPVAAAINVDNSKPILPTPSSATNKRFYYTFNGNTYGMVQKRI